VEQLGKYRGNQETVMNASRKLGAAINSLLEPFGLQLRRLREPRYLAEFNFRTVLDIGANTGQFARKARRLFPGAVIHSFEPLPDAFYALSEFSRKASNVFAHRLALGEEDGQAEMYRNEFSPSSSFLPISSIHTTAFPGTGRTRPVRVPMTSLDGWARTYPLPEPLLLKLDVQGYEDRVLRGGRDTLRAATVLLVEASFQRLYHGQLLFADLHEFVLDMGFSCLGFNEMTYDRQSGAPLQADAVFVRADVAIALPSRSEPMETVSNWS